MDYLLKSKLHQATVMHSELDCKALCVGAKMCLMMPQEFKYHN